MQGAANGCRDASGASVQRSDNGVAAPTAVAAVAAVISADELRALRALVYVAHAERIEANERGSAEHAAKMEVAAKALSRLLAPREGDCGNCYVERARIIKLLNEQMLDETQASTPGGNLHDIIATSRDLGYRGGWNDRSRSLSKELTK